MTQPTIQSENSRDAYARALPNTEAARLAIVRYIDGQRAHGATCDEIEVALGMRHQSASARITELRRGGKIEAVGKRPTRTGSKAAVYVTPRFARKVQKGLEICG